MTLLCKNVVLIVLSHGKLNFHLSSKILMLSLMSKLPVKSKRSEMISMK